MKHIAPRLLAVSVLVFAVEASLLRPPPAAADGSTTVPSSGNYTYVCPQVHGGAVQGWWAGRPFTGGTV